jgi:hypothetical protein
MAEKDQAPKEPVQAVFGSTQQAKGGKFPDRPPKDIDIVVKDPLTVANQLADLIAKQNLFPKRMVTVRKQDSGAVGIFIQKPGAGQPETAIEVWKGPRGEVKSGFKLPEQAEIIIFGGMALALLLAGMFFGHWLTAIHVWV